MRNSSPIFHNSCRQFSVSIHFPIHIPPFVVNPNFCLFNFFRLVFGSGREIYFLSLFLLLSRSSIISRSLFCDRAARRQRRVRPALYSFDFTPGRNKYFLSLRFPFSSTVSRALATSPFLRSRQQFRLGEITRITAQFHRLPHERPIAIRREREREGGGEKWNRGSRRNLENRPRENRSSVE